MNFDEGGAENPWVFMPPTTNIKSGRLGFHGGGGGWISVFWRRRLGDSRSGHEIDLTREDEMRKKVTAVTPGFQG